MSSEESTDSPPAQAPESGSPYADDLATEPGSQTTAAQQPQLVCPRCGSDNREQSLFCAQCGVALVKYCSQCGRTIGVDLDSCDHCSPAETPPGITEGRCQHCGFQNDQNAESCEQCGARLLARCPQCGALTRPSFSFCPQCGFHYSRYVTNRLLSGVDSTENGAHQSRLSLGFSSAFMIALVFLSVLLMIYILWQI